MKAMIFAAGLGTRLRPITNDRPKAMVEVHGMPLLEIAIKRLKCFNITNIVINVHHYADMVEDFLAKKGNFGVNIEISDEREALLNTGGGLKKAAHFFKGETDVLICNVDILSNIDLSQLIHTHQSSNALATLAVRNRESSRGLLFDKNQTLKGWHNKKTGESKPSNLAMEKLIDYAFSGIHVVSTKLFELMPVQDEFSIIDVYLDAMQSHTLQAYPHNEDVWLDVGKIPALKAAWKMLRHIDLGE